MATETGMEAKLCATFFLLLFPLWISRDVSFSFKKKKNAAAEAAKVPAPKATSSKESSGVQRLHAQTKEADSQREATLSAARDAELAKVRDERAREAAEARSAAKDKERQQLEEEERQRQIREHQAKVRAEAKDEEAKERKKQEKLDKARREEEARVSAEERAAREAERLEREEKLYVEREARKKRDEEERRQREEEERRRADEYRKRRIEEQRKAAAEREVEAAKLLAIEGEKFAARRAAQEEEMRRWEVERETRMSADERERARVEKEEREAAEERRARVNMVWNDKQKTEVAQIKAKCGDELARLRLVQEKVLENKRMSAGKSTTEFFYFPVPVRQFHSLGALHNLAAETRYDMGIPEWVVIGKRGASKSNVVDALLGLSVFRGVSTKRPFRVRLKFDGSVQHAPSVVFERDTVTKLPAASVEPFKIATEVTNRNVMSTEEQVITLRYCLFWDMAFLVLSDLEAPGGSTVDANLVNPALLKMMMLPTRLLLWVDSCADDEGVNMAVGSCWTRLMGVVDRDLKRSTLVVNGLSAALSQLTLTHEANALVGQAFPTPVFFVTFGADKVVREEVVASSKEDVLAMKNFQTNIAYEGRVGIQQLGQHIQNVNWQVYSRTLVPQLQSHVNSKMLPLRQQLQVVTRQLQTVEPSQLRAYASLYLMEYLLSFRDAVLGIAGDPLNNGETVEEERESCGLTNSGWRVAPRGQLLMTDEPPYADERLLGVPAMRRLSSDFELAVKAAPLMEGVDRKFGGNCGPARSGVPADFALTVSDLVTKRCGDMLRPLMKQVLTRALHITKNLTRATESAMMHRKSWQTNAHGDSVAILRAPFFHSLVRNIVDDFLDMQKSKCMAALEDSFQALMSFVCLPANLFGGPLPMEEEVELNFILDRAKQVVESLRDQFGQNCKYVLHEHMVEPLFTQVQNYVQARVAAIPTGDIEATLEPEAARARLYIERVAIEEELSLNEELRSMIKMNVD